MVPYYGHGLMMSFVCLPDPGDWEKGDSFDPHPGLLRFYKLVLRWPIITPTILITFTGGVLSLPWAFLAEPALHLPRMMSAHLHYTTKTSEIFSFVFNFGFYQYPF